MRVLALALLCVACAPANRTDPVTGEGYYSPLGNDFASQDAFIRSNYITETRLASENGALPEPEIVDACREIFDRVAAAVPPAHRRDFSYRLLVTASPDVNAYTYGGGRVHCHLGLIARCRDAAEFASVVAHEIGHNSHDHIGQSIGRQTRAARVLGFGRGVIPGQRLVSSVAGLVATVSLVRHTREEEREADARTVEYLFRAGFDADGAARFFEGLAGERRGGLSFFQTHPSPANRVAALRADIAARGGVPVDATVDTHRFARARARAREILPHYEALAAALAGDDVARIERAADRGITALPHHPQFHFWKALAREAAGDAPAALMSLRRAAARDETNVLVPLVLAIHELAAGDLAAAEAAATRALDLIAALPMGYLLRGVARYGQKRRAEAFRDFDAAGRLLPDRERREMIAMIRERIPEYEYGG